MSLLDLQNVWASGFGWKPRASLLLCAAFERRVYRWHGVLVLRRRELQWGNLSLGGKEYPNQMDKFSCPGILIYWEYI